MIHARLGSSPEVLLLGPVRGLASEVPRVVAELDAFGPNRVGLGLSTGELQSLRDYFVLADAEPVVPLTTNEASEVRGLVRFGEARVPNPSFVQVLRWAEARGVPADPLDPDDDHTAALFATHIGYIELVRRTVRERRVSRSPPTPSSADEFALQWDREVSAGRGSRSFANARDDFLAGRLAGLRTGGERWAIVVDRERFDAVRARLLPGVSTPLSGS